MSDDEYQVTIARYGASETHRSDVFLNYHLYAQPDAPVGMDYFVWVAGDAARTVVIDTGFASDAAHYYDEYEHAMPFGSVADLVAMYQAFDTIRAMLASGEVAHLVSGHDPSTMERFDRTGELAGHAATIGSL